MGACVSSNKTNKYKINNFELVKIPVKYELIKIVSFNIDIRNTVNISNLLRNIISYINLNNKNKEPDIICLQGIHDYPAVVKLIKEIKKHGLDTNKIYYFAPEFNDINVDSNINSNSNSNSNVSAELSSKPKVLSNSNINKKIEIQNIIVSIHPIINIMYSELNIHDNKDEILGKQSIIGANISIYGNIISVYNTSLSWDIKTANIVNKEKRKNELKDIFKLINNNKSCLITDEYKQYVKTDVHFLVGSLNIQEFIDTELNVELEDMLNMYHCIDVFRFSNDKDYGYTCRSDERLEYIMLILGDDVYSESDVYYNSFISITTKEDLFDYIFKKYKIYFLDTCVFFTSSLNYPVETVFMLYKNNH